MKQLALTILLLSTATFISNKLFAQVRVEFTPAIEAIKENIDPPYTGRGWHKIHKRPVEKLLATEPYRKTNACPKCHQKNNYRINDPHTQLTENGDIIREKCLYCHLEKPDEKSATFTVLRPEIKFNRNLEVLCLGCHGILYKLAHPVNANHLRTPSPVMLSMMKTSEAQFDIILPLDFDGKIMCATCHNPHEKGVLPIEKASAKGASESFRVRLIGQSGRVDVAGANTKSHVQKPTDKICLTCHKDKSVVEGEITGSLNN
ncbi:MAG: hypothetical protein HZB61_12755 [Nitrospirae bacterium]|nr:hypothetical protein [Nitrospirota bacterium]